MRNTFVFISETVSPDILSALQNNSPLDSIYHALKIDKNGTVWRNECHEEYICDFTYGVPMLGKMVLKTRAVALIVEHDCVIHSSFLLLCCFLLENGTAIVFEKPLSNHEIQFIKSTCRAELLPGIELSFNPFKL